MAHATDSRVYCVNRVMHDHSYSAALLMCGMCGASTVATQIILVLNAAVPPQTEKELIV